MMHNYVAKNVDFGKKNSWLLNINPSLFNRMPAKCMYELFYLQKKKKTP